MAVFPDRIVLKNSTDAEATIRTAIETGGTDAITQGEIVLGLDDGSAALFTKDSVGNIVTISDGAGVGTLGELGDVDVYGSGAIFNQTAGTLAPGEWQWNGSYLCFTTPPSSGSVTMPVGGASTLFISEDNGYPVEYNCSHYGSVPAPTYCYNNFTPSLPASITSGTAQKLVVSLNSPNREVLNYNFAASKWESINLPTLASGIGTTSLVSTVTTSPTLAGINGLYATDAALIADGFSHISALNNGDDTTGTVPTTTGGWDSDFNTVDYLGQGIASSLLFMGINTNGAVYATPTVAANPNPTGRSGNYITDSQNVALYVSWFSQDMVVYRCGYKRVTQDGTLWFVVRADMKMYGQSGGYPVETWFGQDGRIRSYWGAKVGTSPTMTASNTHQGIASNGASLISAGISNSGDLRAAYTTVVGPTVQGLNLEDLADVDTGATTGQGLIYNSTSSAWVPTSVVSLATLQAEVAASTSFSDFQTRIAAL